VNLDGARTGKFRKPVEDKRQRTEGPRAGKLDVGLTRRQSASRPDISVFVLSYNHFPFIDQSLRSVIGQQTKYSLEIIVGDDGSDDGTSEIVANYARRYPDIVKAFHRDRSDVVYMLGKPTSRYNMMKTFAETRGRYVAWLDGDDFYTDMRKLDIQAAMLNDDRSINACCHKIDIVDIDGRHLKFEGNPPSPGDLNAVGAARRNLSHISTYLSRNETETLPSWFWWLRYADWPFIVTMIGNGGVGYLPDAMSAYRRHPGGGNSGDSDWHRLHMGLVTARVVRSSHPDHAVQRAVGEREFTILSKMVRNYRKIGKPRARRVAAQAAAGLLLSGRCPATFDRIRQLRNFFQP
jgi:glycosyltransferase involved in cell wall biosynthesis